MHTNDSDDALRSIVFGPGHSSDEVRSAAAELLRRSSNAGNVEPEPEEEAGTEEHGEGYPLVTQPVDIPASRKSSRTRTSLTALTAFALGIACTTGYVTLRTPDTVAENTTTVRSVDGDTIYEVANSTGDTNVMRADALLDRRQSHMDASLAGVSFIDRSSAHYAGTLGTLDGVWVARSLERGYCIIMVGSSEDVVSSCAEGTAFNTSGVTVSSDGYQAYWNGSSAILSLTQ